MREVNFTSPYGEEVKGSKIKFHERARVDDTGDVSKYGYSQTYEVDDKDGKYLVAARPGLSPEQFEKNPAIVEAHRLAGEVLETAYPLLVSEFCASGLGCTGQELKKHYLSKEAMRERFVLVVGARSPDDEEGTCVGKYDLLTHRYQLYLDDFLGAGGELSKERFFVAYIHELLHYVSNSYVDLEATEFEEPDVLVGGVISKQSGFHQSGTYGSHFGNFNEGITQLYTVEMVNKILPTLGWPAAEVKEDADNLYRREMGIVKKIIELLSSFSGVTAKTVWEGWKSGYLTGGVLSNYDVRQGLDKCFGHDFLENFLAELGEKKHEYFLSEDERLPQPKWSQDPLEKRIQAANHGAEIASKILEKRWQANGGKKVK